MVTQSLDTRGMAAPRPDHRSPRWLGVVSGVMLLLSGGAVVATVTSLWHLLV